MSKSAHQASGFESTTHTPAGSHAVPNSGAGPESVSGARLRAARRSVGEWFSMARGVCGAHPRLLLGMWAGLLLVAAIGTSALGWQHHVYDQAEQARQQAAAATAAAVPDVLSYNYRTIDEDLARARSHLTGDFAGQFDQLTRQIVAPQAIHGQINTHAEIAASSVVEADVDRVVELLFVNQTTQGANLPQPRVDGSRLVVTMQKVHNQWLIQNLEPI
jgi:Mce-associated membrane protein